MAISKELFVRDGPARVVLCDGETSVEAGEGVTLTVVRLSLTGVHAERSGALADAFSARASAVAVGDGVVDVAFEWGAAPGQSVAQRNDMIRANLRGQITAVDAQLRVQAEQIAGGTGEALA